MHNVEFFYLDCVTISVNGLSLDNLIAELTKNNIKLRNITRKKRTEMHITIYCNRYNDFVRIANRHGLSYSIIKRKGALHSLMSAVARPIMLIGSLVVILAIVFANFFRTKCKLCYRC